MKEYNYILEPYDGMKTRHTCPQCGKKGVFAKYISVETKDYISGEVGRCNREDKCGYHYSPKDYFNVHDFEPNKPRLKQNKLTVKPNTYFPFELFQASLKSFEKNHFVNWLVGLVGEAKAEEVIAKYFIGTSNHWEGATIFYQIDIDGKIRTGKIMLYNEFTGKRVKEPFNHIHWAHKLISNPDFALKQCFFGEHLLKDSQKTVCIVESEKTAVIASVYIPDFIWLACGSLNNLNEDKCKVFEGRKVILYPDLKAFENWKAKSEQIKGLTNSSVSDLLEQIATDEERESGFDLADYLVKIQLPESRPEPESIPELKPEPKFVMEVNPLIFSPKEDWTKEIEQMEDFFQHQKDVPRFINTHLTFVKAQNGNKTYLPYLDRVKSYFYENK